MNGEIELKLEVDLKSVARIKRHPLLKHVASRSTPQLTIYYDTASGALGKHGYSLRVRSARGGFVQTVKPIIESAGLFARDEWESPVASIKPDLGKLAGLPLEPLSRSGKLRKLSPVVRSEMERVSWRLDRNGSEIQLDLDSGLIEAGGRSQGLCELELELLSGEAEDLVRVARHIAERVPVRVGVMTKAERGFAIAAGTLGKANKAGPVAVNKGMTIAEAFTVIAGACIKHYRLNEPLVMARGDGSALHQSRVAMRRLRSAFTLFRPALRDAHYDRLREELRWFTSQLGDARNLDVYLERELADEQRRALMRDREHAYRRVIESMESQRLRALMLDLVGWVAVGDWLSGPQALRPIARFAEKRLDKLWVTIAGPAADIAVMDEFDRHELRIQVKKMRYAVEFLRGVFPGATKNQKRFAAQVEALQEALGKLNDLATARTLAGADLPHEDDREAEAEHLA
ncbi:MAG: CHAD domain-containing protein, partial [Sphingomonas sp.]|nr:CHAD domain-containing protein [Sphingomonas sp.]